MDIINNAVTFENYRDTLIYRLHTASGVELDRFALLNGWRLRGPDMDDQTYRAEIIALMKAKTAMTNAGGDRGSIGIYVGENIKGHLVYGHPYYLRERYPTDSGAYEYAFTGIDQNQATHWKMLEAGYFQHYLDESGPFLLDAPVEFKPADNINAHALIVDFRSWEKTCQNHIHMLDSNSLDALAKVNGWFARDPGQSDQSFRDELYSLAKAANAQYRQTSKKYTGIVKFSDQPDKEWSDRLKMDHAYVATWAYMDGEKRFNLFVGENFEDPKSWVSVAASECVLISRDISPFLILSGRITRPADEMSILPGKTASVEDAAHTITIDDMPPSPGQIDNIRFNRSEETEPDTLADLVGQYAVLHGRYVAAQEELDSTTKALRDKRDAERKRMDECAGKIEKALELHGINTTIYPATKA